MHIVGEDVALALGNLLPDAIGSDLKAAAFQIEEGMGGLVAVCHVKFPPGGGAGFDNGKRKLQDYSPFLLLDFINFILALRIQIVNLETV
jgi:hypothetical protein